MNYRIEGHNGWGDNLHQRAAIRKLLDRGHDVWLMTSTPCVYHDFPRDRLHLLNNNTRLRSQARNISRERERFDTRRPPFGAMPIHASYRGDQVAEHGSVLAAMCASFGVGSIAADFRMPIPAHWSAKVAEKLPCERFILYRPPVARREWAGAAPRNPDTVAYAEIFRAIRGDYPVVSVADIEPDAEWIVGEPMPADFEYHRGELDFEEIAAAARAASFVYTTPGMMTVLAQAVETPCITVFGGYENALSYSGGARWSPWLPLETDHPCSCWSHYHDCDKRIDVPTAISKATAFIEAQCHESRRAA